MPEPQRTSAVDPWLLDEAERVAHAYFRRANGDAWAALVTMAGDALLDHDALEDRLRLCGRQVSHGYTRGATSAVAG